MKKLTIITAIIALCILSNASMATNPTYNLTVKNIVYTSNTTIEFDVYMLHTNYSETMFEYAGGQYMLTFNPEILNGQTATLQQITSDLPSYLRPLSTKVSVNGSEAVLKMSGNIPLQGTEISHDGDGTLIARMKLKVSTGTLDVTKPLGLDWKNVGVGHTTVAAFVESPTDIITTASTHTVENAFITSISSIEKQDFAQLTVYNNPVKDVLKYSINLPNEKIQSVVIMDMLGRSIEIDNAKAIDNHQINLSDNVSSGLYNLNILTDRGSYMKKFVVAK